MTTTEFLGERTRERDRFGLERGWRALPAPSLELANRRITHNHARNRTQAWSRNGAFSSRSVALFVELGAIAYMAFAIRPF
jgi:hypothetical protein